MTNATKEVNMLKSNIKLALFLIMTTVLLTFYLSFWVIVPVRNRVGRGWFKGCLGLCALDVKVEGKIATERPVLYTANHVSYLDIPIIGALLDGCFVAKQEVAAWPLFGFLAKLSRTVFINRATMQTMNQRQAMSRRLSRGNLILFPEGTSSNGRTVLPFKSTLFSVARHGPHNDPIVIQPISIAYARDIDGAPLIGPRRDEYSWHGDMTMLPHLRRVFGLNGAEVRIIFHEPVLAERFETRKDLARYCHARVLAGVERAHREALEAADETGVDDLGESPVAA